MRPHPPEAAVYPLLPPPSPHSHQALFDRDPEQQGVRLRVTAKRAAQDAAPAPLHEELLDRAAFEERAQAAALAGGSVTSAAAPPGRQPSRLETAKSRFSALRPFVIISLSYLLFTTTDGAVRMVRRRMQRRWLPPCERDAPAAACRQLGGRRPTAPNPTAAICRWCCCTPTKRAFRPWKWPLCFPSTSW